MIKLFYSPPKLLGFVPPEKPDHCPPIHYICLDATNNGCRCERLEYEYNEAYAEAKANALEVGNVEILDGFELDMQPYIKIDNIKIYSWPGSAVIKDGKYILEI